MFTQEPATPLYEHVESGLARTPRVTSVYTAATSSSNLHRPSPEPQGHQADPSEMAMETQEERPKSPVFPGMEDSATVNGGGKSGDIVREMGEKITSVFLEGDRIKDMGVERGRFILQSKPDSTGSINRKGEMEHEVAQMMTKRDSKETKVGLTNVPLTIVTGPEGGTGPSAEPGLIFPPLATRGSQEVGGFTTNPRPTWKRKARGGQPFTEVVPRVQGGKRPSRERNEKVTRGKKKIKAAEGLWLKDDTKGQLEDKNGGSGLAEAVEQPHQPS